ncbi:spore gernimation protein GerA [Cohnella kolymensis]|uniref:Spore gernimation protein GerA n=2 Tax=Cohnella kolymensis TaxID=1590652 RepID=A0ABR5A1K5_9BACL|nr:spore gernimation protein GerA [Cohnella kolymensis]
MQPSMEYAMAELRNCADLNHLKLPEIGVDFVYFGHFIGSQEFTREISEPFTHIRADEVDQLLKRTIYKPITESQSLIKAILSGEVAVFHGSNTYSVKAYDPKSRAIEESQTESVIVGPHDGFVEEVEVNVSLIRRRVKSSHLKVIKLEIGELTKNHVYVMYINDVVNMEHVNELVHRISGVEMDAVFDGNMLVQYIEDNPNSIFPLFISTERPDTAASMLAEGKVIAILNGSPSVICAPASFFEFFSSPDDYYQRWPVGSALRLLRLFALFMTLTLTPIYVSVTTFHYEMVPETLLLSLAQSRSRVPFPPLFEAILMEITIELLREAGARLPTKIGQTIGIVGGIVIGQAAVQAGITSNILIIAVASSAIASFVIPSYIMSSCIRLVRFPLIILAGLLGNFGFMLGIGFIIVHLAGLTSLKNSYLTPLAPSNLKDWGDIFIRAPFSMLKKRPFVNQSPNPVRNKMRK